MPIAIWTSGLVTGDPTVDKQHRRLFRMINDLHHATLKGDGQDVMGPTMRRLAAYTVEHFAMEESLMLAARYPQYGRHKPKHVALTGQVLEMIEQFEAGELTQPLTLSRFFTEWLTTHIHQEDMELIRWIQEQGIPRPRA